jgi:hypothetical protein
MHVDGSKARRTGMPHAKAVNVHRHVVLLLALHADLETLLQGFMFTFWAWWGGGGVAIVVAVIAVGD